MSHMRLYVVTWQQVIHVPKPHKKPNLLECPYLEQQLFQLLTLTTASFLMLSLVQIFHNWSTFQQNRTI